MKVPKAHIDTQPDEEIWFQFVDSRSAMEIALPLATLGLATTGMNKC